MLFRFFQMLTAAYYFANYSAAAHALLARMHLYLENWDDAISYADKRLSSTNVQLVR
jgi:hypothetical protein